MAIERHRHSWGGWDWEKISFNDLKDKPQIPIIKQITRVWSLWVSTFTADIWCNTRLIRIQCGAISASWQEWSDCSVAIDQDGTWDKWKWLSKSAGTSNIIIETARIVSLTNATWSNQNAEFVSIINGILTLNFIASTTWYDIRMTITCY